jgi:hypothetical protein
MPPSPVILQDLRDAYATGELVVFVGAGVPASAGRPRAAVPLAGVTGPINCS